MKKIHPLPPPPQIKWESSKDSAVIWVCHGWRSNWGIACCGVVGEKGSSEVGLVAFRAFTAPVEGEMVGAKPRVSYGGRPCMVLVYFQVRGAM